MMERLRAPYRIILLLMGLIVLASVASVAWVPPLPFSSHFRENILRLDLIPIAYLTVLYPLNSGLRDHDEG